MRKHSVRKWLHAILDLLPLFVIPIFAIYARNENAQFDYEVTINETWDEVTPMYESNEVNTNSDLIEGNIYELTLNGLIDIGAFQQRVYFYEIISYDLTSYVGASSVAESAILSTPYLFIDYNTNSNTRLYFAQNGTETIGYNYVVGTFIIKFKEVQYDNIDISSYFSYTDYQDYEIVHHEEEPVTYNDTDIGSQMIYTLYNTVDKYFNMNNVFNMSAIWNWVNNTMFGGSAPLSAYIVYQIIAYELIMDIIFLIYTVMMFVVDFAEKGIDRFLGRSC